jgi:hypothetical protein
MARRRWALASPTRVASVRNPRRSGCAKSIRSDEPSRGLKLEMPPICVERLPDHETE